MTLRDFETRHFFRYGVIRLTMGFHFYDSGNMDEQEVISALSALAQENRLRVFRLLVTAGPKGLPAGQIAEELSITANTLSFHLAQLKNARCVAVRREGRSLIYSANYGHMQAIIGFLTENCCTRKPCCDLEQAGHE
jgi:ArsR family transcriptional regulator, arsenate/arsenite/antimonite-responsive transcriptional repressor